jgi:hypothetical protein
MDLPDRSGRQRGRLELGKDDAGISTKLLLDNRRDGVGGHWRDPIAQLLQLGDQVGWEQVRSGGSRSGRVLRIWPSLIAVVPRSSMARACLTARVVGSGGCQLLDVGGRVVRRHELTDQAWAEIAPLLPTSGRPGGQWADHRRVVNGILWKLATGVPGGTCLSAMALGRPAMSGSAAGRPTAPGNDSSPTPRPAPMRSGRSTGRWWWTPRSCEPTSTPPVPEKGNRPVPRVGCRGRPGTGA